MRGLRRGEQFQRGLGRLALCEKCNRKTAVWYGDAFASWTQQGFEVLSRAKGIWIESAAFLIKPSRVIKQASLLMIAQSHPQMHRNNWYRDLCTKLLSPTASGRPHDFRVLLYMLRSRARMSGMAGSISTRTGNSTVVYAEVALPPFGYCFMPDETATEALVTEFRMADITRFFDFGLDQASNEFLNFPILTPDGIAPLHYRDGTSQ